MRTKHWNKQTVILEGCSYIIEYCPQTEEIIVHQPAKVIIGYRKTIGNHHPEVCTYSGTGIETDIAQLLIMERPKEQGTLVNGQGDDVRMPKCLTTIKDVKLNGSIFSIAYDWNTDLIVINVPELVTHKHRNTLEVGHSELKVLHDGRLLEEIQMFLFEYGNDELDFNPEDVF